MIKLEKVIYRYPSAEFLFNCEILAKERVAIVGKNGVGKSTFLNLIAGFIKPLSGTISLMQQDMTKREPFERPISMLFQENNLIEHLTIYQNLALLLHKNKKDMKEAIVNVADELDITDFLQRLPSELSGGQKQRAALAKIFLSDKPIILLDEAFSALDADTKEDLFVRLNQFVIKKEKTLLMITHQSEDISKFASMVLAFSEEGILATKIVS